MTTGDVQALVALFLHCLVSVSHCVSRPTVLSVVTVIRAAADCWLHLFVHRNRPMSRSEPYSSLICLWPASHTPAQPIVSHRQCQLAGLHSAGHFQKFVKAMVASIGFMDVLVLSSVLLAH
jgi:hypothetical protein